MIKKLIHIALSFIIFTYIIFEEVIWENIAKPIYNYLHSLKIIQKVELFIHKQHRLMLLIFFVILFIIVELLGFIAVAFLAKGDIYSGVLLYICKIPVGIITFWLFRISKDKLITYQWFSTTYDFIIKVIDKIKKSQIYQNIESKTYHMKVYLKGRIKIFKTKYLQNNGGIKIKIKKIYQSIKERF